MFDWVHYQFPSRVYFERDATHKIGTMVRDIGNRILILAVQDELSNPDELAVIKTSLEKHTTGAIIYDDIASRPGFEDLDTAAYFARQCNADAILAFGSRTTFHAARAISLLANNDIFAADLQHATFPLKRPPHPIISVPTGPAMGEESTPAFSVYNHEQRSSFHAHDNRLFPAMIFIDPNISSTLPAGDLAKSGIAVMSAAVETILSKKSNEITNSIALRALELITRNLTTLIQEPGNQAARMNVSMASMLCGMAHSNSMLGLTYSIAAATANLTNIDFFMAMSILLPHIMEYNLTTSAGKYVQIARALDEDIKDITVIEAAIKAVEGVRKIYLELKIPQRLSEFEISKADLPDIAEQAFHIPFTKNTPRELDRNEIETILIAAY
ncbi:MAG: iron-containing alcohol dehydrogenase [Leptospirales bacterium]